MALDFENKVLLGDCLDVLRLIPDATFDSCVTDPPYGLGTEPTVDEIIAYLQGADLVTGDFMGKDWDIPSVPTWREIYRVLKPGAHVLCFGGTRTFDLISMGLRAAGFENRDTIADEYPALQWCQGMGMPKSLNVSKAIDKAAGAEREVVGVSPNDRPNSQVASGRGFDKSFNEGQGHKTLTLTAPATPEAQEWEGWGTGLKPAWEPILVFRKPLSGTVAANVLEHGTGALNIDATRVRHASKEDFEKHHAQVEEVRKKGGVRGNSWKNASDLSGANEVSEAGRWPANMVLVHSPGCKRVGRKKVQAANPAGKPCADEPRVRGVFGQGDPDSFVGNGSRTSYADEDGTETVEAWECVDGCPVRALDEQSGDRPATLTGRADPYASHENPGDNHGASWFGGGNSKVYADAGGASRYFSQFEGPPFFYCSKASKRETSLGGRIENDHPTKKPLALMQWLVRLVTPKNGLVLDPYCGSGSTLHAAVEERLRYTGIEKDAHAHEIASKRMAIVVEESGEKHTKQDLFDQIMSGELDE